MEHMFDPTFVGQERPIEVIECDLTPLENTFLNDSETWIRCSMQGRVLTDPNDGWSFDTFVEITLIRSGSYWRIQRIAEVLPGRASPDFPEFLTWGRIKSMFREPLPGGGNP
jgi:hypothetical protein